MSILSLAVEAADTTELAAEAAVMVSRCHASGLDPDAYRCVIAAMVNLGANPATGGPAWWSDREFVGKLIDLECELYTRLQEINRLITRATTEIARIDRYTPVEQVEALHAALDVLRPARARVTAALNRVIAAPDELTGTYAACYRHVRAGKQLPYKGRFISGAVNPQA
ncbi:hypothetical protein [Nonomuraea bangladeshensis]|uniref:hypothetical protein n=1 Tax=Nonomuraea bangladeshensis TaxID=404385 RepID=UPI0031DAF377